MQLVPAEEPSDEDIFVAEIAHHVAEHARPLFEIAWLWLGQQALHRDDNEP